MRYLLSFALLVTACTRANPDAIGGNGGSAGSGGGGAAGAGGGGAGGSGGAGGGGGTVGGGEDLAMSSSTDLAQAPDLGDLHGVACGMTACMKGQDCCVGSNGGKCTSDNSCTGGPHPTLWACDGPEDCPGGSAGMPYECCANSSGSACDPSCAQVPASAPMCHTMSDCPGNGGYVACCVIKPLPQYSICSKQACLP